MAHPRYVFMIKSADVSHVGNVAVPEGNIELIKILGEMAVQVGEAASKLDDGRFEIVSHDIIMTGSTMTVTFLLRHPGDENKSRKRH